MSKTDMAALEAEAAEAASLPVSQDKTARLLKLAEEMETLTEDISSLESQLAERNTRLNELRHREMPDLMIDVRQDKIGMPDWGATGADLVLEPFYRANIGSEWPEERREAAFAHLEKLGAADLVKNVVSLRFDRGSETKLQVFLEMLDSREWRAVYAEAVRQAAGDKTNDTEMPPVERAQSVPWQTLTAFVREWYESPEQHEGVETELKPDTIGATIGSVVKIKIRKGKK